MPELPEVETVRRGLVPRLVGRRIVRLIQRRRDLRVPLPAKFAQRVEGRRVQAIDRRAKYLLLRLDDGNTLIAHLGMSGRMTLHDAASAAEHPFERHDHVVLETEEGWQVRFNDARRFGLMLLAADEALPRHKLFKGLGPEPLDDAFDGAALAIRLKGRRTPIKAALLDQKTLVGVGNIYACEALFLAGISPRRSAHTVQGDRAERLVAAIKQVLLRSIDDGGSTLRDHVQPGGELGYFQTRFNVRLAAAARWCVASCSPAARRSIVHTASASDCGRETWPPTKTSRSKPRAGSASSASIDRRRSTRCAPTWCASSVSRSTLSKPIVRSGV